MPFDTHVLDDALVQRAARLEGERQHLYFFRHAYVSTVDPAQLQINLHKARQAQKLFHRDVVAFLEQLRPE